MSTKDSANLVYEIQRELNFLEGRLNNLDQAINFNKKKERLGQLENLMVQPDFWQKNPDRENIQKEKSQCEREINRYEQARQNIQDYVELVSLVTDDEEALGDLSQDVNKLKIIISNIETERMLSGPNDINNAILSINVGQGGVDSQDFSEILLRMYKRYAERKGFAVQLLDLQQGEEAGIKSATVIIYGQYAYGYLKSEIGVHRLVRISPFDSGARRHTSFASVWVIPEITDDGGIDIKPDELRIDTFRAGGAGGQHVNKTDSAVRITHIPTNTVVVCQAERSQLKNRATAMKILKARLHDLAMRERLREKDKAEAQKMEASFGSQIRNYVLAPYRLVKDLRTNCEVGNVDAVLDGDIQNFIDEYLLKNSQS